jgi:putative FmdB family regulatory protein
MPVYTYRREDGTTFELRQKFTDDALTTDPQSGQKVTRVVSAAGVIFKGTGFYVNDSKGARNPAAPKPDASDTKAEASADSKSDGKTDTKTETKPEAKSESKPEKSTPVATAAD